MKGFIVETDEELCVVVANAPQAAADWSPFDDAAITSMQQIEIIDPKALDDEDDEDD